MILRPCIWFFLMQDILPVYDENTTRVHQVGTACTKGLKLFGAISFAFMGFLSLLPALFWTFIYKWLTSSDIKDAILTLNKGTPL